MAGLQIVPVTARTKTLPCSHLRLAAKINDKTKAILLCNPGNPTGTVYAPESLDALAQLVRDHDLYLFADEVYREFCYDGAQPKSVLHCPGGAARRLGRQRVQALQHVWCALPWYQKPGCARRP